MKNQINTLTALALNAMLTTSAYAQTLKTPAPSPSQTVTQAFGIGELKIDYSRPSVKGRAIFGELVPYGKIWRTGANAATKITLGENMKVNGTPVTAGTYAIYTTPSATEWEVMLYKDLELGGSVEEYKVENELMRFKVKPAMMNDKVETFTIAFNDVTFTTCNLDLMWDKTKVSIPLVSDHDGKVMKNIEASLAADKRPYFAAASYYYENGKDLTKAMEWCNKAIELNPKAYWMTHTKAKIQKELKDYKGAMATAELSKATAVAEKDGHYTALNDKLLADLKKMAK